MRRSSSESDGFPVLAALAIFSFSFVCCFLARLHWVREEAVAGQGVVVEEHVLESGVVAEVEGVLAGTDGEPGGDQQDSGRAPQGWGSQPFTLLHFSHFTVVDLLSKDRLKDSWFARG